MEKRNIKIYNLIASIVFILMQYSISINVFLMGDDFMYGSFANSGILKSVYGYYYTGNGRWFINILDSFLLKFDRYMYVLLLPWLVFVFAYLLYKIADKIVEHKYSEYSFIVCLLIVSVLNIEIARETVYWITGCMNYLVPSILFLLSVYLTLDLDSDKYANNRKKIIYILVCIVSSMTVEQFSLMTVGWLTFYYMYNVWKNKKLETYKIITYIFSIIALFSIIIAPGNFVRIQDASLGNDFFTRMIDLFYTIFYSQHASQYVVIILMLETVYFFNKQMKKMSILSACVGIVILSSSVFNLIPPRFSLSIICFVLFIFINYFFIKQNKDLKNINLLWILMLVIGSQIMLLVGEIWGFRTAFSVDVFYILMIICIFNTTENKYLLQIIITTCLLYSNVLFGIVYVLLLFVLRVFNKKSTFISSIFIVGALITNLLPLTFGYYENSLIHRENIQTIQDNKSKFKNVELNSGFKEKYGWTLPPLSEFHQKFFNEYYGISEQIHWKEVE